jgi:hypothetical protein
MMAVRSRVANAQEGLGCREYNPEEDRIPENNGQQQTASTTI